MLTDFDDLMYPDLKICYDCLEECQTAEYVLLANGELAPLCYECAHKRRMEAYRRMGENEKPVK